MNLNNYVQYANIYYVAQGLVNFFGKVSDS